MNWQNIVDWKEQLLKNKMSWVGSKSNQNSLRYTFFSVDSQLGKNIVLSHNMFDPDKLLGSITYHIKLKKKVIIIFFYCHILFQIIPVDLIEWYLLHNYLVYTVEMQNTKKVFHMDLVLWDQECIHKNFHWTGKIMWIKRAASKE